MITQETSTRHSPLVAAEVWTRSLDEGIWRLDSSLYGDHETLHDQAHDLNETAEGELLSQLVETRAPVIVRNAFATDSPRDRAAREAGAAIKLGIPVVTREGLTSVLLLLLRENDICRGAFEIWERAERDELGLADGHYLAMPHFADISPYVKFPHGSGLPGKVWDRHFPAMLTNVGGSAKFARALAEQPGEHFSGIGLPVMVSEYELTSVILMLSSDKSPIARAYEAWAIDGEDDEQCMRLESYLYPSNAAPLREISQSSLFRPGEGLVGRAWANASPVCVERLEEVETQRVVGAKYCGLEGAIALPICAGRNVRGVFVMYP